MQITCRRTPLQSSITLLLTLLSLWTDLRAQSDAWVDVSVPGPTHSAVTAVAPDGSVFVGLGGYLYRGSGLFRSTDHGITWTACGDSSWIIMSIAFDMNGRTYVGTRYPAAVHRSTDGGATWSSSVLPTTSVLWSNAVTSSGAVLAATEGNMYRSTDEGSSWQSANAGLTSLDLRDVRVSRSGVAFAKSYTVPSIYRSTDHGVTWSTVGPEGEFIQLVRFLGSSTVLAAISQPARKLKRSTDNGLTWFEADTILNEAWIDDIASDRNDRAVLLARSGFHRYDGVHWQHMSDPPGWNQVAIDSGGVVFVSAYNTTSRSTDLGATWYMTGGSKRALLLSVAAAPNGLIVTGSNTGAIFRSTDHGTSWSIPPYSRLVASPHFLAFDTASYLYAVTDDGLWRSTDSGTSWDTLTTMNAVGPPGRLAIGRSGLMAVSTYGAGLYRSTDQGVTWNTASTATGSAVLISRDNTILASAIVGSDVTRSTDRGTTWTWAFTDHTGPSIRVFAQSPEGTLFAGRDDGRVFASTDDGISWSRRDSTGLPGASISALLAPRRGFILASQPSHGVYASTDDGVSWALWDDGIPHPTQVRFFAVDPDGHLFAASDLGLARSVTPLTHAVEVGDRPVGFRLHQNFPNPFNPSTEIEFSLDRSQLVRLTIVDILGRPVAELIHEERPAGLHRVSWNARTLAGGVYFARLQCGTTVDIRRMMFLR